MLEQRSEKSEALCFDEDKNSIEHQNEDKSIQIEQYRKDTDYCTQISQDQKIDTQMNNNWNRAVSLPISRLIEPDARRLNFER